MSPLSAAVARVQFKHLSERNARRNRNIEYLSQNLEKLGVHTFLPPPGTERVYFQFLVQNDSSRTGITTDKLVAALKAEGCDAIGPRYPLLHQQPVFTEDRFINIARLGHLPRESLPTYRPDALPQTTAGNAMLIQLPSFPSAERTLLDQYTRAFEKVLSAATDISEHEIA
jgi:dTDP-4-amino-4,6-dideoxygalactose transaminase